jgi:hypothetical protein
MATSAQRIADLERQVADLAAEVEKLRGQAATLYTLEEMWIRHGWQDSGPAAPPRRRRHLTVLDGSAP